MNSERWAHEDILKGMTVSWRGRVKRRERGGKAGRMEGGVCWQLGVGGKGKSITTGC